MSRFRRGEGFFYNYINTKPKDLLVQSIIYQGNFADCSQCGGPAVSRDGWV